MLASGVSVGGRGGAYNERIGYDYDPKYAFGSKRPPSLPNLTVSCLPPLSALSEQLFPFEHNLHQNLFVPVHQVLEA
jgi:hypothetical protein